MLVVNFAATGSGNCVQIEGRPYVFARSKAGSFVMPARCGHRGGPLHLGEFEPDSSRLVCPWHGKAVSLAHHMKAGVAAVRMGNVVWAVFAADESAEWTTTYKPLSAALRNGCAAAAA